MIRLSGLSTRALIISLLLVASSASRSFGQTAPPDAAKQAPPTAPGAGEAALAAPEGDSMAAANPGLGDNPGQKLRAMFQAGDIEATEKVALQQVTITPADPDVRVVLANCYRARALTTRRKINDGDLPLADIPKVSEWFDLSFTQLGEALKLAPDRQDIWLGVVQIRSEAGDMTALTQAIEEAASHFAGDGDFATTLRSSVIPYLQTEDYTSAAAILNAIARSNPGDLPTLLNLGRAQYLSGKRSEGVATLEHAVDLHPEDAETHFQRAEIAAFEGDFHGAALHFARCGSIDPQRGDAVVAHIASMQAIDRLAALRAARAAENRYSKVNKTKANELVIGLVENLRASLEQPRQSAVDLLRIARTLTNSGMLSAAVGEIKAVLQLDPEMTEARFLDAEVRSRLGQHELAVATLKEAIAGLDARRGRASGVTRDELLASLGNEYFRMEQYVESLNAYSKLAKPDSHAFEIALVNDRLGRRDEAARRFRQVIELQPDPDKVSEARRFLASPPYQKYQ